MKRSLLFIVFVLSSSVAFSQGLAFSQILMLPHDVQGTVTNINGDNVLVVQVPQGKVWKITSVPRDGYDSDLIVKTNINANGLQSGESNFSTYYYETDPTGNDTRPNLISSQPTIWLGENHSLQWLLRGSVSPQYMVHGMLNVIEYDVVP